MLLSIWDINETARSAITPRPRNKRQIGTHKHLTFKNRLAVKYGEIENGQLKRTSPDVCTSAGLQVYLHVRPSVGEFENGRKNNGRNCAINARHPSQQYKHNQKHKLPARLID